MGEVKKELFNLNFSIHRVSQHNNFKTKVPIPVFLCNIFPSNNLKSFFNVYTLFGSHIKLETYLFSVSRELNSVIIVKNRATAQGNVLSVLYVLKCAVPHQTYTCKIQPKCDLKSTIYDGNHTANIRGCDKNLGNFTKSSKHYFKNCFRKAKVSTQNKVLQF